MNLYKKCFYEEFKDEFMQYLAEFGYQLRGKMVTYDDFYEDEEKLLKKYPNLRRIFEDFEAVDLNKEEIEALIQILLIRDKREDVLMCNIFYKGIGEAFSLFKKADILK